MKKADFIKEVAMKANVSSKDAKSVVEASLDVIEEALKKGDNISFIGFGTFATSIRNARDAKVPGTDRVVHIPQTRVVKFKVGKQLKDAVAKVD